MNRENDDKFGTVQVVRQIGISAERLKYWEKVDIINPQYIQCGTRRFRRYSLDDIKRGTFIKKLVDEDKYSLEGAIRKLQVKERNKNKGPLSF